jgi:hypothetical protein
LVERLDALEHNQKKVIEPEIEGCSSCEADGVCKGGE